MHKPSASRNFCHPSCALNPVPQELLAAALAMTTTTRPPTEKHQWTKQEDLVHVCTAAGTIREMYKCLSLHLGHSRWQAVQRTVPSD